MLAAPVPKFLDCITLKVTQKSGLWNKLSPEVTLTDKSGKKFLLNAKKCLQSKPISKFYKMAYLFHISNKEKDYAKDSEGFMGRIKSKKSLLNYRKIWSSHIGGFSG